MREERQGGPWLFTSFQKKISFARRRRQASVGHPSCFSSWDLDMDGCRRWCITALATNSSSRSSLRLSAAEQLSQAMRAYSRSERSIVFYSRDNVSTLTRARYPSFFRAAAFGAALFNMPDTWSDHFSVEARVKPTWETVHTYCSLSPPRTRFLLAFGRVESSVQSEDQVWTASISSCRLQHGCWEGVQQVE